MRIVSDNFRRFRMLTRVMAVQPSVRPVQLKDSFFLQSLLHTRKSYDNYSLVNRADLIFKNLYSFVDKCDYRAQWRHFSQTLGGSNISYSTTSPSSLL